MTAMKIPGLAAALALALSCSPVQVVGGPVEQACQDYAYAYCAQLQACSPTFVQIRFGAQADCETLYQSSCVDDITLPSSGSSTAGRQACTSAVPGWACSDILAGQNPPPACQIPNGALPDGATCAISAQCQTGFCGIAQGNGCGTCAAAPQVGDSCAVISCGGGLSCTTPAQTCVVAAGLGASCASGVPCTDGLVCVDSTTCQAGVTTVGAACDPDGAGCALFSGLGCDGTSSLCVTETLAMPGAPCGYVAEQPTSCLGGACLRGVCVGYVPAGGSCEIGGAPCVSNTRCIVPAGAAAGTCQINGSAVCD